jgi:hypothetical protein
MTRKKEHATMNSPQPQTTTPLPSVVLTEVAADQPIEQAQQEGLIDKAVNVASSGVVEDLKSLRAEMDELEGLVMQTGARARESLNAHIAICNAAQIEVARVRSIVADLRKQQIAYTDDETMGRRQSMR